MNSSKNKGLVTTISAGTVKSIKIEFDSGNSKSVNVYGKNTAYSSSGDINSSTTQGTLIETVANSKTAITITPSTKYQYVAFASASGALYISKITIEWETGNSDKTSTTLSFGSDYDGKTITKNTNDAFETPATLTPAVEGANITYKSSNESVAGIESDGTVYAYKEGTTTITASYAGDDTYAASSASYTLNVVDGRTETTLTFPHDSYTFSEGDNNGAAEIEDNYAVLTPSDADASKISYSVTGTAELAEVDNGYVLVNTNIVGTATVTATFVGDDKHKPSEASYTIKVLAQIPDGVFDFTDGTIDYGSGLVPRKNTDFGSTGYDTNAKWIAGNVTVNTKGNTRWFTNNDGTNELRFYKGSSFTVSVPEGYNVSSVVITGAYAFVANVGTYNASSGKWNGNANSITFTYNAKNGNIAVKTITVEYVKAATLTTAASGFSTYAADYDVDYSAANLEAYAVKVDEANNTVTYTEATGVVPAGKAVLVKGESKTEYTLTPATETATDIDTDLKISDGSVTTADNKFYGFATMNGVSGFKLIQNGLTIPEKKGYLELISGESAKSFFEFTPGTTCISDYKVDVVKANDKVYNMAGQRVNNSYKGLVIKNGKKYVK